MSTKPNEYEDIDDMLPEYDFSGRVGIRGKYYQALREGYTTKVRQTDGTTIVQQVVHPEGTVTLDPDVREFFPNAETVNATLRALIQLIPTSKVKPESS